MSLKLRKNRNIAVLIAASSLVAACGGGGGGSAGGGVVLPPPPPPPPAPYASNCTTTPQALSCQTGAISTAGPRISISTDGSAGGVPYEGVFIDANGTSRTDDTFTFVSYAGAAVYRKDYAELQTGNDAFGRIRTGVNVARDGITGQPVPGDGSRLTLFDIENVLNVGLDYVQLGMVSNGPSNGVHTYFAIGRTSPALVMPATGSASYAGGTRGTYLTGAGVAYRTASDLTMNADFSTGRITGSTSNFRIIDVNGASVTAPAGLNFNFTASITGSAFSGSASNPSMTGSVDGRFYGPPGGAPGEAGLAYSLGETAGGGKLVGVGGVRKQ